MVLKWITSVEGVTHDFISVVIDQLNDAWEISLKLCKLRIDDASVVRRR